MSACLLDWEKQEFVGQGVRVYSTCLLCWCGMCVCVGGGGVGREWGTCVVCLGFGDMELG